MRVKFAEQGRYLFSLGGYDQTLIQWRRVGEESDEEEVDDSDYEESKSLNKSRQETSQIPSKTVEDHKNTESLVEDSKHDLSKKNDISKKDNTIQEESSEDEEDSNDKEDHNSPERIDLNISPIKQLNEESNEGEEITEEIS